MPMRTMPLRTMPMRTITNFEHPAKDLVLYAAVTALAYLAIPSPWVLAIGAALGTSAVVRWQLERADR